MFVSVVKPLLTTCKLYCTGWPTLACPFSGERTVLLAVMPGVGKPATVMAALLVLVTAKSEAAVMKFVADALALVAMKNTLMLVAWPGRNEPRFVQVNLPAFVVLTGTLAETNLKTFDG